jgi:hypothetical protein
MAIWSRSIVPPRRAADAGISAAARTEPSSHGARPTDAGSMPRMRSEETSGSLDQVAAADRVSRSTPTLRFARHYLSSQADRVWTSHLRQYAESGKSGVRLCLFSKDAEHDTSL